MSARRLVAYTHGVDHPAARFRIGQFIPSFERAGWDVALRPQSPEQPRDSPIAWRPARTVHQRLRFALRRRRRLNDLADAAGFDVAFVSRDLLEGDPAWERELARRNPRTVFDFDDAIHLGRKREHFARACEGAAWVTAGNEHLAAVARKFTDRVSVVPTVVDTDAIPPPPDPAAGRPLRLGWLGSDRSIRETLHAHAAMFADLQAELGFELVVVSKPRREMPDRRLRWRHVEWSPATEARIADHFDVGIMPLVDDEFQRLKCGCKLLQYMAAGLPSIATPIGINPSLLGGGRGIAATDRDAWAGAIARLRDPDLRRTIGATARPYVERHYSVAAWFPRLFDVVESVRLGATPRTVALAAD
ncbi:MAG: glycosyltransferase [Burkholderiales bacterium]|jgi:hypothetical protein|nr:glycosyltransferase [Burkholderiales bacterium]